MKQLGLIGKSLRHSFSKKYFDKKFKDEGIDNVAYDLYELDSIEDFSELVKTTPFLVGLNVTIPYKEAVIPFLQELDPISTAVGAVNLITVKEGHLKGYNTDVYGFQRSLAPHLKLHHRRALILGTGGASKAVKYVLDHMGIQHLSVSRNPQDDNTVAYQNLNENAVRDFPLIVNTTPLGTFPNVNECPNIPYAFLNPDNLLVDLIYNPEESMFLRQGRGRDSQTLNGYSMLVSQAEKGWEIIGSLAD